MSFILDALKKSESERQREAAPSLAHAPLAVSRRETPNWVWLVIALLSLALIASGTAWWRNANSDATARAGRVAEVSAPQFTADGDESAAIEPARPANAAADAVPRIQSVSEFGDIDPGLENLRLELLAFNSSEPALGSAWINGRRYFPGERISSGPELIEVRVDGVLLAYRGERFLLVVR
jgi:hypothetical protein